MSTPSALDLEIENITPIAIRKNYHAMLKFDYVVIRDIKRSERQPASKKRYNTGKSHGAKHFLYKYKSGNGATVRSHKLVIVMEGSV